jgi:purine-binding chemotaxis protein CheW
VNQGRDAAAEGTRSRLAVVARVGFRFCAVPLEYAIETMRLLPIEAIADAPPYVAGLSVIRGVATPVVDVAALLGASGKAARLILLRVGARRVAIAVDAVIGVQRLDEQLLAQTPPLVQGARVELIESVGAMDAQLLVVLRASRLLSEDAWSNLERVGR